MTHVELTVLGVAAPQLPPHIKSGICEDPDTGCWLWLKSRSRDGYGWTSLGDKTYQAHRLVYRLLAGEPPEGTVLDHLCRVRHCVNPAHLFLGSTADNNADMRAKGRQERGPTHHDAKEPTEVVLRAREMAAGGVNRADIARQLGVSYWTVRAWVEGRNRRFEHPIEATR